MAATTLAAALTLPLAATAQQPKPPAAAAAPRAAPAAAPRAAPAAPRAAAPTPHFAAPQRAAVPHVAPPQRAAAPRFSAPLRAADPQATQRRAAEQISPRVTSRAANRFEQNRAARTTQSDPARVQSQAQSSSPAAHIQSLKAQTLSPSAQRRADRVERRNEQRVLRSLPANQRAAQREEFRQQHLNAQGNANAAQSNAALRSNATVARSARAQQRSARRNGGTALTAQAARQGRFASRFTGRSALAAADPLVARRAWQRNHRAGFVGWYGPVFWPYAYSDIFDYAFWPDGYDVGYWDYAYDDFFDGLFWGEQGPPAEYVYNEPQATGSTGPKVSYAGVQQLCNDPGSGITAWPFAEIGSKVGLNAEQKSLLDQMHSAATNAAAAFKASCPANDAFPLTPPGRLTAMTGRLDATLQAVDTVKPALEAFYNSLSDEQKERFNELGPSTQVAKAGSETIGAITQDADNCKQPKPGLANLPIDKIEDVIKPTEAQEGDLDALHDATEKAVAIMQAACPDETPLTPTGRLDAMQKRLKAMVDAANTVRPALTNLYATLSSEQKARFNRIGRQLAQSGN
jgi:hypothetical protein